MSMPIPRARWRGLARRGLLLALGLGVVSAWIEHVLEVRDAARLTANETFYSAHERRIRYHLANPSAPGPTLVLLNGLLASLEQWDDVQSALSTVAPVLTYDRGGAGFSDPANAHDANAEADELNQLLHAPQFPKPFVLVSYSSSSMMAIVFVAKHPDLVKGIVFVDPAPPGPRTLPGSGEESYRRVYWRSNLQALQSFFGYTRLRFAMAASDAPPSSPASERIDRINSSAHHWLASAHEAMSLDESANESNAAMGTNPFAHLPLGVLSTMDPTQREHISDVFERQQKLAASSELGIMRTIHCDHGLLLNDPVAIRSVVDLIRTIVDEARTSGAAGAGS